MVDSPLAAGTRLARRTPLADADWSTPARWPLPLRPFPLDQSGGEESVAARTETKTLSVSPLEKIKKYEQQNMTKETATVEQWPKRR